MENNYRRSSKQQKSNNYSNYNYKNKLKQNAKPRPAQWAFGRADSGAESTTIFSSVKGRRLFAVTRWWRGATCRQAGWTTLTAFFLTRKKGWGWFWYIQSTMSETFKIRPISVPLFRPKVCWLCTQLVAIGKLSQVDRLNSTKKR